MDIQKSPKFEHFKEILEDCDLIALTSGGPPEIPDEASFLELGFGFYLLWIHVTQRRRHLLLYFTPIDTNSTLFLVSPFDGTSHFSLPAAHPLGHFYLDSIENLHLTNPGNCNYCHLRNSLILNLSHFKRTQAFRNFLSPSHLREIHKHFKKNTADKCAICADSYYNLIRTKLEENELYGIMLGGYPKLLDINPDVFQHLFAEPIENNEVAARAIEYVDFFFTIYLAYLLGAKDYGADTHISSPFTSFEIDSILQIGDPPDHNLLILETTSFHHDLDSLKSKLLTYSALRSCVARQYLHIYLTLAPELQIRSPRQAPRSISHDNVQHGTCHSIIHSNPDLEIITLSPQHRDLEAQLKNDWWDPNYLRASFDYYISELSDKTRHLRIL